MPLEEFREILLEHAVEISRFGTGRVPASSWTPPNIAKNVSKTSPQISQLPRSHVWAGTFHGSSLGESVFSPSETSC